jgi:endo-1,4-beta-xylanase
LKRCASPFIGVLAVMALLAVLSSGAAAEPPRGGDRQTTPLPNSYLVLSADPQTVAVGAAFTLVISYHNLGLPYTTINVTPTQRAVSDPPLLSPCKYDQHPTGCKSVGLRARHSGVVTITASATGEAYSEECSCWYWTGAGDIGPAVVTITGSSFYMPLLMRSQ